MRSTTIRRTMATVALLTLAAACGGGGSSPLSRDEFLKKGNDLCSTGNQAIADGSKQVFTDPTSQPSPEQVAKFVKDILLPNERKQLDQIDKLVPPKDLQSQVDKLLADARAALAHIEQLANDDPNALFNSQDPFADVNKEAADIGLTSCGSGSDDSSDSGSTSSST
jgi:hypothetical protein